MSLHTVQDLSVVEFAGSGSAENRVGQYATEHKTEPYSSDPSERKAVGITNFGEIIDRDDACGKKC